MKALDKLKNQDFHLGTFLAEFGQTEQMIAGHIRTIAKQVRIWRRKNPKQMWEAVKRYERSGCGRKLVDRIPGSCLSFSTDGNHFSVIFTEQSRLWTVMVRRWSPP